MPTVTINNLSYDIPEHILQQCVKSKPSHRHKLDRLNAILSRSPFRSIVSPESGEYKFYDSRNWPHNHAAPEWDEVTGTTIFGFSRACYFARGIVLGYAQNLVIRTNGPDRA